MHKGNIIVYSDRVEMDFSVNYLVAWIDRKVSNIPIVFDSAMTSYKT